MFDLLTACLTDVSFGEGGSRQAEFSQVRKESRRGWWGGGRLRSTTLDLLQSPWPLLLQIES